MVEQGGAETMCFKFEVYERESVPSFIVNVERSCVHVS